MLELVGVHAHYGLSHILQGVDINVREQEVVGLFGRNGVGKTTTLRCVVAWLSPSAGQVRFNGELISEFTTDRIARRGVAFVPEDRRIFPGLTVEENLELGLLQCGRMPRTEVTRRIDGVYQQFPRLAERRHQAGITLSGGEQQMLTVARALVGSPQLLLIDEPSEGLAPMVVEEIYGVLTELRNEGIAILLVEQNIKRALTIVDRFYLIQRGKVMLSGEGHSPESCESLMAAMAV